MVDKGYPVPNGKAKSLDAGMDEKKTKTFDFI